MAHLLSELIHPGTWRLLGLLLTEAMVGASIVVAILMRPRKPARLALLLQVLAAAAAVSVTCWITFLTALTASFPRLGLEVPVAWAGPALAVALLGGGATVAIHTIGRRSARNALLGGSLLASAISCMLFISMAGVVRPFALAFDLAAVVTVTVVSSALCGFGLWEIRPANGRRWYPPWALGLVLLALGFAVLPIGSLAAILPFEAWIDAVERPDDLTSSPIAIIVATEAAVVLALTLSGSLLDNRVAAREREQADRVRQLADSTFEAIVIHRNGRILDANERLSALLGQKIDGAGALDLLDYIAPADRGAVERHLLDAVAGRESDPLGISVVTAEGALLPVEVLSRSIAYGGEIAQVTALRDVRERQAAEARIFFMAHHDMLTELPNRISLQSAMARALAAAARDNRPMAVLCLDLDRFKEVNDTLGHQAGDTLLRHVASRLRGCTRGGGFAARVGGDEFVLLQQDADQPQAAQALALRIIEQLAAPFAIDGHTVTIGSSVGIAISSPQENDAALLLRQGDIALYQAKESGRGQYRMFEPQMDRDLRDRRELEADLRDAIAGGSLVLHFQPIHACNGGALLGFEALTRWTHPTRGPISPAQFIPIAEESGLIVPLGAWVLRTACAAAASWVQPHRISVNLSPAQFHDDALVSTVAAALTETGLLPSRLDLEVTESILLEGTASALEVLGALRGLGATIVLDDFGTGYSSLSYLHRFSFDKLKIDQSFVRKLESDPGARAIISAIVVMSHKLGLRVTAEGVETEGQRKFLQAEICDELQGYLFGRPMPLADVETLLLKQAPRSTPRLAIVAEA